MIVGMRYSALLVILAAASAAYPCFAQPGVPAVEPGWPYGVELRPTEADPLQFLDALRAHRDVPRGVRVWWPPPGWVRAEDVPALLALMRSTEPAAVTCSVVSAHAVPLGARSTVGREAMRLIEGYRRGRFSAGCSDLERLGDPDELERWWVGQGAPR